MYSCRHRGVVSITISVIGIPVVGEKGANFVGCIKWKEPKIISKTAIFMTKESVSMARTFLVVGDDAYMHPKVNLFRLQSQ